MAQFTAKTTNSEKAIYILSIMSYSMNKLKSHLLFTCKNLRPSICHLFFSSSDENKKTELNRDVINNAQIQKPVGVNVDYKSKFDTHIETLCKIRGETFH